MQKLQLYIEGQRVDLFNDETVTLTQTIKNIRDVSKVFTDFSRSFTLPASPTNNKIFKHFDNYFIDNGFDARNKVSATIEINDIPFRQGKIRLDGVEVRKGSPYSYKVTFFGNTVNLKDLFGEEKLGALPLLDDLSKTYDNTTVKSHLQLDPASSDVVVPLITHTKRLYYDSSDTTAQTGNLYNSGTDHGVAWSELKYAIRVHKIIEAIEDRYGITFNDDGFFSTSNAPYYNLFMWLHRNKGAVTSVDDQEQFTKLIDGWSVTDNTGSFMTTSTLTLKDKTYTNLSLTLTRSSTTPFNISITRNGTQIFSQTGINSTTYPIDLLYAAQQYASYQVTISYSAAITFTGITWSVNYSGAGSAETYNTGTFNAPASFEFVVTDQIPEIKVIDFVTGLFKLFNLTAESKDGTNITVETLNTYYAEGTPRDITNFIDAETSEVNASIPYKEISFKYEDTESILAANHSQLTGQEWSTESYNSLDDLKEGEAFEVEVPFSHFKYERLINAANNADTTIQWGWAVDSNQDSYIGKPLLFYPILNSHAGILFVDEVDSQGLYSTSSSITSDIVMPSNSITFDSSVSESNINFKLERNEYSRDTDFSGTLFQNYYFDYIAPLFSKKRRLTKLKAKLPVSFLINYSLADKLTISDKEYNINSITTNLNNGMSDLELLNVIPTSSLSPTTTTTSTTTTPTTTTTSSTTTSSTTTTTSSTTTTSTTTSSTTTTTTLQTYYLFNACDGGTTVIDVLGTPPSQTGQRYVDFSVTPEEYYTYTGFTQQGSGGYPIVDLQPVTPEVTGCPTTTTTTTTQAYQTLLLYEQSGGGGWGNSTDACDGSGSILVTYIATGDSVTIGTVVYTNTGLTTPLAGNNGWYQVQGTTDVIQVAANGTINDVVDCATTTTTTTTTSTTTTTTTAAIDCTEYQIDNDGTTSVTFSYQDCTTGTTSNITVSPIEPGFVCARTGTLQYVSGDFEYTIFNLGSC